LIQFDRHMDTTRLFRMYTLASFYDDSHKSAVHKTEVTDNDYIKAHVYIDKL